MVIPKSSKFHIDFRMYPDGEVSLIARLDQVISTVALVQDELDTCETAIAELERVTSRTREAAEKLESTLNAQIERESPAGDVSVVAKPAPDKVDCFTMDLHGDTKVLTFKPILRKLLGEI